MNLPSYEIKTAKDFGIDLEALNEKAEHELIMKCQVQFGDDIIVAIEQETIHVVIPPQAGNHGFYKVECLILHAILANCVLLGTMLAVPIKGVMWKDKTSQWDTFDGATHSKIEENMVERNPTDDDGLTLAKTLNQEILARSFEHYVLRKFTNETLAIKGHTENA